MIFHLLSFSLHIIHLLDNHSQRLIYNITTWAYYLLSVLTVMLFTLTMKSLLLHGLIIPNLACAVCKDRFNYLLFNHSQRLRGLNRWAILRREGKGTRMLLQELDKVLDSWHQVSQGKVGKPVAVGKDVSTCFHLAMATRTMGALCREKALSELPNGSMVKNGSSRPGTQDD